ncbi:MAG: hypothetical protein ACE5GJ_07070 [Gemmatimonadota bacterium]
MPESSFSHAQIHDLEEVLAAGGVLRCPECGVVMDRRSVPPRSEVSYVRDRLWLVCPRCHRSAVLDRPQSR